MAVVGLVEEGAVLFAWAGGVDGAGSGEWAFELEGWETGWKSFKSSMLGAQRELHQSCWDVRGITYRAATGEGQGRGSICEAGILGLIVALFAIH